MFYRTLAAAAVASAMATGSLYAQEAPVPPANLDESTTEGNFPDTDPMETGAVMRDDFASDLERSWYDENRAILGGFFTDGTMAELAPDEQISETFAAMGAEDQSEVRAACDRVENDRGSYGNVTVTLCSRIGEV